MLEQLAQLGEFVGGIGVVVTFVYLAIQIRQNTAQLKQNERASRLATERAIKRDSFDLRAPMIADAEVAKILRDGLALPGSLDEGQLMRFRLVLNSLAEQMQFLYQHRHEGVYDERFLAVTVESYACQPGFVEWWRDLRHAFSEDFVDYVDHCIAEGRTRDPHWQRRETDPPA